MAADPEAIRSGLSRRQMIKGAAIAGAAAWTAPVIIDSLASPAAAVTGVSTIGCSWVYVFFNKPDENTVYYSAFQGTRSCGTFASNQTDNAWPGLQRCELFDRHLQRRRERLDREAPYGGTCPRGLPNHATGRVDRRHEAGRSGLGPGWRSMAT